MMQLTSPISLGRGFLLAAAAAVAALAAPASAPAVTAPTVSVEVGERAITVAGADDLRRGPVRLHVSGDDLSGSRTIAVVELKSGDTAQAADHQLDDLLERGRLVAGGRVSADAAHVTTINARSGDHLVVDVTSESGASARFTVGDVAGSARLPRSDATIGLRDKGFYLPSLLPRAGVLRIANQGDLPHQATAYRLKRTTSFREAVAAAVKGRVLERLGAPTALTGLLSPGAVNRVEVDLRAGRYLVVSDYTPSALGTRSDVDRGLVATTRVR